VSARQRDNKPGNVGFPCRDFGLGFGNAASPRVAQGRHGKPALARAAPLQCSKEDFVYE